MIKQPINKRRRFVEDSNDASHSTLVEKAEEPINNTTTSSTTAASMENDDDNITVSDRLEFERGLSRRKRKTLKKQEKFEKRKDLIKRMAETKESMKKKNKKQTNQQQQGIFSFDPMSKLLQHEETSRDVVKKQEKKESNEVAKKNKKMKNEIEQFTNVLNHPVFQSNPLQVIQQHLKNKMQTLQPAVSAGSSSATSKSKKNEQQTQQQSNKQQQQGGDKNKQQQRKKIKFNTNRKKESFDKNIEPLDKAGKRKRND